MSARTSRSKTVSSDGCSSEQDETLGGAQKRSSFSSCSQWTYGRLNVEHLEDVAWVGHAEGGAAGIAIVTYDLDPAVVDASYLVCTERHEEARRECRDAECEAETTEVEKENVGVSDDVSEISGPRHSSPGPDLPETPQTVCPLPSRQPTRPNARLCFRPLAACAHRCFVRTL
jgi:hypothetical protein